MNIKPVKAERKTPTHAGGVYMLLAELWPKDAYATIGEVGNATGARTRRHVDAVVMSIWPSRGLHVYGVEIKVSRSDWLAELRNPEKAEEIARYCDGWYLAVSESKIVQPGELPPTWGLIACDGGKAKIAKPAPAMEPKPLDRPFVAAMLRRAAAFSVPDEWLKEKHEAIWNKAHENAKAMMQAETDRWKAKAEALSKAIADFESVSGVKIDGWHADESARAFKTWRRVVDEGPHTIVYQAERFERAAALLREVVKDMDAKPEAANGKAVGG